LTVAGDRVAGGREAPALAVHAKLVLVAVIWGGTFIAGRVAVAEMPATTAAFVRYAIASVALVAAVLAIDGRFAALTSRQWLGVWLLGATGVAAYNLCFMIGLTTVPAGRASLIVALNPVATLAGSALLFREKLSVRKATGMLVALVGAVIVIARGDPRALVAGAGGVGEAFILGAVLSFAAFTLITKRLIGGLSPLSASAYASLTGTALLAAAVPVAGDVFVPDASLAAWASLAFLGAVGTAIAFVWYSDGVRRLGPSRAAVYTNLVPVAAVVLGMLLLGESLEPSALAGGALVVAGVWTINARRHGA